ncbi:GIY-YIG nuclease family protein [Muricomes intestini]|jgi:hypothetical protein|uniref:GIY-YIG catalytic domain-containing protein n=1 Tax=Muricomes intestini TaxID=1796634 RepID=A0A4R3K1X1_9FIRM|nr:GIY-YIG nuclease family protein [Muricomes intestini]TCS75971.1 hypothetical protein EDD59_12610 [Muricomes intestini]HAX52955.1 hypothetical protein [Lachnospiraceae bacterium]HCR83410.1 hypothetical protein [Lachnospiraceae bacterium]
MDTGRKKLLKEEYKLRRPEMGIISYRCKSTGESFLGISKDTKASFNSNSFKLSSGRHPNKNLQELWTQYGENDFELSVVKVLKYKDPADDYTEKLEKLFDQCLTENQDAKRIWK